jgi:multidrug efflux pump subunit AcrB
MANNLSINSIKEKIKNENVQLLGGYLNKHHLDFAISGDGKIKNIDDIKNIAIAKNLYLKDIASITYGKIPQRYLVHLNGKEGIALLVFKNQNANTINVIDNLDRKIENIQNSLPKGMKIIKLYDQSKLIKDSSSSLKDDILIGIVLVFIMMLLFLGNIGNSLYVALSVPIIAIVTLIVMNFYGLSLNMITIGAVAVAIGMVVDDSIIILESILRHREMGKTPMQASIDGTKEIAWADVSGTLTTVAAFIPFIFIGSLAGKFTEPFAVVLSVMLLLSLIISLSIIPAFMAHKKNVVLKKPIAYKFVNFIQIYVSKLIRIFEQRKKLVFTISTIFLLGSAGTLAFLPISFLPQIDEGSILLEYHLPPGTSLKESNKVANKIESLILDNKNVSTVYRRTGSDSESFSLEPVNQGELIIQLKNKRNDSIFKVMKELREKTDSMPGLITIYHQVTAEKLDESMTGLPAVFALCIYGSDYDKLLVIANKVEKVSKNIPGIAAVVNNTKYKVPQLIINPKKDILARYGVSSNDILNSVRLNILGQRVGDVINKQTIVPIFLKSKSVSNIDTKYLKNTLIKTSQGYIPLKVLASISQVNGSSQIEHINMQRVVTLPMEVDGNIQGIVNKLFTKIGKLDEGYFVTFEGQYKELINMAIKFGFLSIIGAFLIYIIMALQLGNARHPFAILLNLPFLFSGAFITMFITHSEVNLSFFIGLITLMGVGVNNGIVLIDYINKLRAAGIERIDAIHEAVKVRTRPILLTVLTAIIGMLPISFGIGLGSQMQQSLAISVIGGLFANTFFTLTVLPLLYIIFDKNEAKV